MLNTDYLRAEVEKRCKKRIDADDPIFITLTLNDLILSSYIEKFEALLEAHETELSEIKKMEINESIKISTVLINRTLEALGPSVTVKLQEDFQAMSTKQLARFENTLQNSFTAIKQTSQIALFKNYAIIGVCCFIFGFLFKSYVFS